MLMLCIRTTTTRTNSTRYTWWWWRSMKIHYGYHILVITTVPVYPFINIKIHTEKIQPLSENYNALFERHNFLHLTCPLRLLRNTAKSQSTSNSKETGLKMHTQHNSHGTFMPLQKKKCTSYYGCLWCCC